MTDQKAFEEYTGFTENEVRTLCVQFDMDFEETRNWYDVQAESPSYRQVQYTSGLLEDFSGNQEAAAVIPVNYLTGAGLLRKEAFGSI